MKSPKTLLAVTLAAIAGLLWWLGGEQFFDPEFYRTLQSDAPAQTAVVFFVVYVITTAFSFPGAAALTLIGGWLFGFSQALLIISFASTIGATLAFLLARTLLRQTIQSKFSDQLTRLNTGIEEEGAFYLFSLRLIPLVPFFVINLAMGLTPMKTWTFYWVSQLGMLAGTAVYVNAGAQLANIEELSVSGILTPGIMVSFILIGLFPLIAKKALSFYKESQHDR